MRPADAGLAADLGDQVAGGDRRGADDTVTLGPGPNDGGAEIEGLVLARAVATGRGRADPVRATLDLYLRLVLLQAGNVNVGPAAVCE